MLNLQKIKQFSDFCGIIRKLVFWSDKIFVLSVKIDFICELRKKYEG